MKEKRILFNGLFSTGKTSFIAALWYYVTQGNQKNSLVLNTLKNGEHEYLNAIRDNWVSYEKVDRTSSTHLKGERVIMDLRNEENGELITLDIPDFSGETFNHHFDERRWTKEYDEILTGAAGVVIFVNASHKNNVPNLIINLQALKDILQGEDSGDSPEIDVSQLKIEDWQPEYVPNQVKLVDFLQFILYHKPEKLPIKVAFIISAWDLVEQTYGPDYKPSKWLQNSMPLLSQFLITNRQQFVSKAFGVSAQGCDYKDQKSLNSLLNLNHLERINVVDDDEHSHNIARPILWITE